MCCGVKGLRYRVTGQLHSLEGISQKEADLPTGVALFSIPLLPLPRLIQFRLDLTDAGQLLALFIAMEIRAGQLVRHGPWAVNRDRVLPLPDCGDSRRLEEAQDTDSVCTHIWRHGCAAWRPAQACTPHGLLY